MISNDDIEPDSRDNSGMFGWSGKSKILVQKFGGTSLQSLERMRAAADIVKAALADDYRVVVVASAMGHSTDELLRMTSEINTQSSLRELDMLLATGEQVSASLLSMTLSTHGVPAMALTGQQAGIVTDSVHGSASILRISTGAIQRGLAQGKVVVVTGYQGATEHGDITTLGRGGSDTTAVALAGALRAVGCDIYSDVDGIYTADPTLVKKPRKLASISTKQMLCLAKSGAQVMSPASVEYAHRHHVSFTVRSVMHPSESGTLVSGDSRGHIFSGIACEPDQDVFAITPADTLSELATISQLIRRLNDYGIATEVVKRFTHKQTLCVEIALGRRHVYDNAKVVTECARELGLTAEYRRQVSKLSIVGDFVSIENELHRVITTLLHECICPLYWSHRDGYRLSVYLHDNQLTKSVEHLHSAYMERELAMSA